jgi:hypothetical protein
MRRFRFFPVAGLLISMSVAAAFVPGASALELGSFAPPSAVVTQANFSQGVHTDFSPTGEVVVAWVDDGLPSSRVMAVLYTPAGAWTQPVRLDNGSAQAYYFVDGAVTAGGYAAVVFQESSPANASAVVFEPGLGWGAPFRLLADTGPAGGPSLYPRVEAMGEGEFAFMWKEGGSGLGMPFVGTWKDGFFEPFGSILGIGDPVGFVDLAADSQGRLTAAWVQFGLGVETVFACSLWSGVGCGRAEVVGEVLASEVIQTVRVSQGAEGAAVVTWVGRGLSDWALYAAVRSSEAIWQPSQTLQARGAFVGWGADDDISAAFSQDGRAFVGYVASGPLHTTGAVRAAEPQVGWGPAWLPNATSNTSMPALASGLGGATVATWISYGEGVSEVFAAVYTASEGWSGATRLATGPAASSETSAIGLDAKGNATAVWTTSDGSLFWTRIVDSVPPALTVVAPADGTTVSALSVMVALEGEPGATVFGSGVQGTIPPSGRLTGVATLTAGVNTITLEAVDANGNRATASVVVYAAVDPNVSSAQLNATLLELADAQAELEAIAIELQGVSHALNDTNAANVASTVALAVALEELNRSKADLNTISERLSEMEGNLTATSGASQTSAAAQGAAGVATLIATVGVVAGLAGLAAALWSRRAPRAPAPGPGSVPPEGR